MTIINLSQRFKKHPFYNYIALAFLLYQESEPFRFDQLLGGKNQLFLNNTK